eukprot:TRINITY_DN3687_c0_g1_i1.p1 TRINITY_DN3687_c0_g1~~TRINITY_DN3687_c0_g1_i1.p1  ORF type:complete len:149 (-),score=46.69 TRINITY_DN3687_c0_g1_i1:114-527(-)
MSTPEEIFFGAAKRSNEEILLEQLAAGVNINTIDTLGNTALHWAASGGHEDTVEILLDRGAKVNPQNNSGDTPLHLAAWRNHPEACAVLVKGGADRNVKNKEGKTPLQLARNVECQKSLVQPLSFDQDEKKDDEDSD